MTVAAGDNAKKVFPVTKTEMQEYVTSHEAWTSSFLKKNKIPIPKNKLSIKDKRFWKKIEDRVRASKISAQTGSDISVTQSAEDWQIIYGTQRVGGLISFVNSRGNNQWLDLIVTVACHRIYNITRVFLDDDEVLFEGPPLQMADARWSTRIKHTNADGTVTYVDALNKVFMSISNGDSALNLPNADAVGQNIGWTNEHLQTGRAYVYMILVWNAELFPDGLPDITFEIQGKLVYDPRSGTVGFNNNAALCVADYMMNPEFGLGIPIDLIDMAGLAVEADACDEAVAVIGGGTEKRYTVDGIVKASESPQSTLEMLIHHAAGTICFEGGLWRILVGRWRTPVLTIDENDILGAIQVSTKTSRRNNFNGVRGTFVNPTDHYNDVDYPSYRNHTYISQDNNEVIWEDIDFPLSHSPSRCQRIGKIIIEETRAGLTASFTCTLKILQAMAYENFYISNTRLGWNQKTFRLSSVQISIGEDSTGNPAIICDVIAKETASGVYDWNSGEETAYDLTPNSNLPNPKTVFSPTGLILESGTDQLYVRADGTVFSRIKVSWDAMPDFFVSSGGEIACQYKQTSSGEWIQGPSVPGDVNSLFILDVRDRTLYDVRIQAINALGNASRWNERDNYYVVGKTEPPSNVTGLRGTWEVSGIRLFWIPVADPDVAGYEIRYGPASGSWSDGESLGVVTASSFATAIHTSASYIFMVKARDTSGNESINEARLAVDISAPSAPTISGQITGADLLVSWTVPQADFQIDSYILSYGVVTEDAPIPSLDTSVQIVATKTTSVRLPVNWVGTRWFWVRAVDVNGNTGAAGVVTMTVTAPGKPVWLTNEVVDNNVLLRWKQSNAGTLPIAYYQFLKGDEFASAELLGQVYGTFATHFEQTAGTFTYWLFAVDSAGNQSLPTVVTLSVSEPPDFVLRAEGAIDAREAKTASNIYIENYGFISGAGGVTGPGGIGSPIGLLAAITLANTVVVGPGGTAGQMLGLLAALTYSTPSTSGTLHKVAMPRGTLIATPRTPSAATTDKHKVAIPLKALALTKNAPGANTGNVPGSSIGLLATLTHN